MCPLAFLMEVNHRAKQRDSSSVYVLFPRVSLSATMCSMFAARARGPDSILHIISSNLTFFLSGHIGAIPQLSGRIISELYVHI